MNSESLPPCHGASSGCGCRSGLRIWKTAANILNKQSRTGDKGWSPAWRFGEMLRAPHHKNVRRCETFHKASDLDWSFCHDTSSAKNRFSRSALITAVQAIKSRSRRGIWHVWERGEVQEGFWWGKTDVKIYLENLGVDGRIILEWILKKWNEEAWTGLLLAQDRDRWPGSCDCRNKPFGYIRYGEFLDWLRISPLPRNDSAACN